MVPVVLVKHRKDEVFLVRFLSDNNELSVDLGQIRFRFTDGLSEAAAQALTGDGNGGVKRGRKKKEEASEIVHADSAEKVGSGKGGMCDKGGGEVEKKRKRKSKGKMWDELMEEDDKKGGPQMSREERKALAVWQRIINMESQVPHGNGPEEEGRDEKRKGDEERGRDNEGRQVKESSPVGGAVRAGAGARSKDREPAEQDNSGGGGKRKCKWEDAVPAYTAKTELSREDRKMQQQLEIFKKMEMLHANANTRGVGNGKRECVGGASSRVAGAKVVEQGKDGKKDDGTAAAAVARAGAGGAACREALGCAVGPEVKSELTREERKMQQQLELFKKMEAAAQKDEAAGGAGGGKANASEKAAGQRVGAAKERKTVDADREEEVSGASSDEEEEKRGRMRMGKGAKSRWEDAVRQWQKPGQKGRSGRGGRERQRERACTHTHERGGGRKRGRQRELHAPSLYIPAAHVLLGVVLPLQPQVPAVESKSTLSREERKMQQQMELFKKMEALREGGRGGGGGGEAGKGGKDKAAEASSSEEEESSEDEEITPSTPKPKYELEVLVLAKSGKHLYVGKV